VFRLVPHDDNTTKSNLLSPSHTFLYPSKISRISRRLPERCEYEYEGVGFEDDYWFTFGDFACFLGRHHMLDMIQKKGGHREKDTAFWTAGAVVQTPPVLTVLKYLENTIKPKDLHYYLKPVLRRAYVVPIKLELEDFIDYIVSKGADTNTLFNAIHLPRSLPYKCATETILMISIKRISVWLIS